jgi:hypothetical protein
MEQQAKITIKEAIIQYVRDKRGYYKDNHWGGTICRDLALMLKKKYSCVERKLRELTEDKNKDINVIAKRPAKLIDGEMVFVERGGNMTYRYCENDWDRFGIQKRFEKVENIAQRVDEKIKQGSLI